MRVPILHVFLKLFPTRFSERYAGSIFTSPCTVPSTPRRTGRVDFPSLQASRAGRFAANATCKPAFHEMRCQSRTLWSCVFHRIRSCSGPSCGNPTPCETIPHRITDQVILWMILWKSHTLWEAILHAAGSDHPLGDRCGNPTPCEGRFSAGSESPDFPEYSGGIP